MTTPPPITINAVGWLKALQFAGLSLRQHRIRQGWTRLRQELRYMLRQTRVRNWRAVKNTFNGYLAEHESLGRRCGTGWTKRRAIRDLYRHLAEVTAPKA
jgi:hypothetical protein